MAETAPLLLSKSAPAPAPPSQCRSYFELTRLHKFPIGTLVLFWPCGWSLVMAAYAVDLPPKQLAIQTAVFFVGGTIVHSAACVLSDICDREFDGLVERTKNRPLVTGRISVFGATMLLLAHLVATIPFFFFLSPLGIIVAIIGLVPLHALYPLMKRWTYWPQAWLGLTMSWGAVVAWVSVTGSIDRRVVTALVLSGTCHSIFYDTIYACQDKKDDVKAGVKSTAVLFGEQLRPILSVFGAAMLAFFAYAGFANHQGPMFYGVVIGGTALHFTWQMVTLNGDDSADCLAKFKSNHDIGYLIWTGLLIDYYLKVLA